MAFDLSLAQVESEMGKTFAPVWLICSPSSSGGETTTVEAKKMHRSYRLAEKQDANLDNEAQEEPEAKKSRWDNRIATMDNETMVEVLKFLNYCQLAKSSQISKGFRDIIQTHRHKLALLYVKNICMRRRFNLEPATIKIFNKELSSKEYCAWVVCNNYPTHIPPRGQVYMEESIPYYDKCHLKVYELRADADYKDPEDIFCAQIIFARKEVNNETWPLFQHFIRLLTDPFIYICSMELVSQNDVFNLLVATIDRNNRGRLQCEKFKFTFESSYLKFFTWIKNHVRCDSFRIDASRSPNCYKQLLDLFSTGSQCTSEIEMYWFSSKAFIIGLVQKFMGLKNWDESHIVHLIRCDVKNRLRKH
ncbi:hypothetical protein Ddc_14510 [Ditylenchus destructor]|nr:hypothetical protein Ddc_14510 [Ditylenchus destructor]